MDKFISYAQNCEDVMLWRALRGVTPGYYIDIGANHPVLDSVTKSFYDRGWHGMNVEPIKSLYEQLVLERPNDINLCCAVSSTIGRTAFYDVAGTGLSTIEPSVGEGHAGLGYDVRTYEVPVFTLTDLFDRYNVTVVHFLKIDVEGAEKKVLEGMPFDRVMPWIIVVEGTRPNTQIPSYADWEPIITSCGYSFVYFDGCNRYYVSAAHLELALSFHAPPNAFDDYVNYRDWSAQQELRKDLAAVRKELSVNQMRVAKMRASWSWRLTKPLRGLGLLVHCVLGKWRRSHHK